MQVASIRDLIASLKKREFVFAKSFADAKDICNIADTMGIKLIKEGISDKGVKVIRVA